MNDPLVSLVSEFYRCENSRDWGGMARLVDPNITSYTSPTDEYVTGRGEYINSIIDMYRGRSETFEVLSISSDVRAATVHAEISMEGKRSVNVFEIRDNVIAVEREYLGEGYV
ncbi:nuclear transport factor 2 family protein [Corynebacterium lowii]|uniref:nuclear transport factor 2 family protein n=1 Tax=Corynebacterium lowii TaxID=1544413 RepID=UPI0012E1CE3B|nr:nuclear transport factor 2 family protein [Corynebacterium lowii]MDP9851604.1 hypothetical protein [Corynebacterium lowii]